MRIFRIFNNNVVATLTDDRKEAIVQGSGIGFQKKPGDMIDESKIEKLFIFHDEERTKFDKLMEDMPIEYFQIAQEIADMAREQLDIELSNTVLISLTDHISFAIEREKQGVRLPNLMLSEVRSLYPSEYQIGQKGLRCIKERTGAELADDEAGYIAIHIVNAELNVGSENTTNILRLSKGVIHIVENLYGLNIKEDSLDSSRLLTHLKFLAQRIFTKETVKFEDDKAMSEWLKPAFGVLIQENTKGYSCIHEITKFIKTTFSYDLSKEEQVYLMIHLQKVIS